MFIIKATTAVGKLFSASTFDRHLTLCLPHFMVYFFPGASQRFMGVTCALHNRMTRLLCFPG